MLSFPWRLIMNSLNSSSCFSTGGEIFWDAGLAQEKSNSYANRLNIPRTIR
jgi:hypothetical protein